MLRGFALLLPLLLSSVNAAEESKIEWIKDYDKGIEAAKESWKPVVLFFTADW